MSHQEYQEAKMLEEKDTPFYALIMAAMRRADTDNLVKLRNAFPETWKELDERYHMPGGLYITERYSSPANTTKGG